MLKNSIRLSSKSAAAKHRNQDSKKDGGNFHFGNACAFLNAPRVYAGKSPAAILFAACARKRKGKIQMSQIIAWFVRMAARRRFPFRQLKHLARTTPVLRINILQDVGK